MTPAPPKPACQPTVVARPGPGVLHGQRHERHRRKGAAAEVAIGPGQAQVHRRRDQQRPRAPGTSRRPRSCTTDPGAWTRHSSTASQIPGAKLFGDTRTGTSVDVVVGLGYKGMVPIPARLKPIPSEVKVNVYNTTYKTGLAKTVADAVAARGFKVKEVSNDPLRTMQLGTAVIRYGEDGDLAAALLQGHVPGAQLVKDNRLGATARPRHRQRVHGADARRPTSRRCPPDPAGRPHGGPSLQVTTTWARAPRAGIGRDGTGTVGAR